MTPGRPRKTPQPRPTGPVRADAVYPLPILRQTLGWGNKTMAKAIRDGLPAITYGRGKLVLGEDLLAWIRGLRDQQRAEGP